LKLREKELFSKDPPGDITTRHMSVVRTAQTLEYPPAFARTKDKMSVGLNRSLQGAKDRVGAPHIEDCISDGGDCRSEIGADAGTRAGCGAGGCRGVALDWLSGSPIFRRFRRRARADLQTRWGLSCTEPVGYAGLAWIAGVILHPRAWGQSGR
jgi:hypothetical protein